MGIVHESRVVVPELLQLARMVRRDGETRERLMAVKRPPLKKATLDLRVRAARLGDGAVFLSVEDRSQAARIDAVRRDFVANVSHELKTPVGALALLAEAVSVASDDPAAVVRFSERMHIEADRLSSLIKDIVDLSRLESDDPMASAERVDVEDVVAEALDANRMAAAAKEIEVVQALEADLHVYGRPSQLAMALRNLLANAISYSPERTRVAVTARWTDGVVEIAVKDQGIGIPAADVERIFERFYRVDDARSRQTGGTGLGLAIVKHVCVGHGGECTVWSVEGAGSTFTMRIPGTGQVLAMPGQPPDETPESAAVMGADSGGTPDDGSQGEQEGSR